MRDKFLEKLPQCNHKQFPTRLGPVGRCWHVKAHITNCIHHRL